MAQKDYELERFLSAVQERYHGAEIHTTLTVLWDGWESDNRAAVISTGGAPFLVTTDHGKLVRIEDVDGFLRDRRRAYEAAGADLDRAAAALA